MLNFRMTATLIAAISLSVSVNAATTAAAKSDAKTALHCGWFDNPTPQNASLTDRDGEWLPKFKPSQWARTHAGSYGYGCARFRVSVDKEASLITHIASAYARPLSACRDDNALKASEPYNTLK